MVDGEPAAGAKAAAAAQAAAAVLAAAAAPGGAGGGRGAAEAPGRSRFRAASRKISALKMAGLLKVGPVGPVTPVDNTPRGGGIELRGKHGARSLQVSHGLQLQSRWRIPAAAVS